VDSKAKIADYLYSEFSLGESDIALMLSEYTENLEHISGVAIEALQNESWDELIRSGHSVKGTSSNVGASALARIGSQLEAAADSQCKSDCVLLTDQLVEAIRELKRS